MKRTQKRVRLRLQDCLFWILLQRFWPAWKNSLLIVHPDTVVRWHKKGFKLYWRWKSSKRKPGRPRTGRDIRELVLRMATENPLSGAPRLHGELLKLGLEISERTVSNLMPKERREGSSQTWVLRARRPAGSSTTNSQSAIGRREFWWFFAWFLAVILLRAPLAVSDTRDVAQKHTSYFRA